MKRNPQTERLTAAYLRNAYVTRGLTGIAIAREVGVSQAVVYERLVRAGIPRRPRGLPGPGARRSGAAGTCADCGAAVPSGAGRYCDRCAPTAARTAARLRMRRIRAERGHLPRPGPVVAARPDEKWCPHCQVTQPRTAFRRIAGKVPRIHSWCRTCERAWQRRHAAARRGAAT